MDHFLPPFPIVSDRKAYKTYLQKRHDALTDSSDSSICDDIITYTYRYYSMSSKTSSLVCYLNITIAAFIEDCNDATAITTYYYFESN